MPEPLAYFITFTCYGCRLHGDDPYTVDRRHRTIDGPHLGPNERFRQASVDSMKQDFYTLDEGRRRVVLGLRKPGMPGPPQPRATQDQPRIAVRIRVPILVTDQVCSASHRP